MDTVTHASFLYHAKHRKLIFNCLAFGVASETQKSLNRNEKSFIDGHCLDFNDSSTGSDKRGNFEKSETCG